MRRLKKMNLFKNIKLKVIVASFLLGSSAFGAATTITFSTTSDWVRPATLDTLIQDADNNSNDRPGQVIQIFVGGSDGTSDNENLFVAGPFGTTTATSPDSLLPDLYNGSGYYGWIIKSTDGSEFSFESFLVNNMYDGYTEDFTIEGFKDGVSTGTNTATVAGNSANLTLASYTPINQGDELTASNFENVDEIRVYPTSAGVCYFGINSLIINDAVGGNTPPVNTLPTAPTVAEDDTNVAFADTIAIADTDDHNQAVTLTATNGTLSMTASGTTFTTGDGTDDAVLAFNGTLTNVNTALDTLTFTPTANFNGTATLRMQTDDSNGGTDDDTLTPITVSAVADTPSTTGASTSEDIQSSSGLVLTRNASDSTEVTHFKITNIANGTLYQNNGSTAISSNDFITFAEGNAGLKFTPTANSATSGTFDIQAGTDNSGGGLSSGSVTATITVSAVGDTPSITNATTNEDIQSTTGLVISRSANDSTEVTHFKITNIANGTLYKNDGSTEISSGAFITFAEGDAGLKFTPSANSTTSGTFDIQADTDGAGGGLSSTTSATVTINAVNDAPTLTGEPASVTVIEDLESDVDLSSATLGDIDSTGATFTLKLTVGAGTLSASDAGSVTVTNSGTATMTLTGTPSNINTFLDTTTSIKYTSASNASGTAATTLTLTVNDQDGSGELNVGTVNLDITDTPDVTAVAYDFATDTLTVTGNGFTASGGGADDVDVSTITLTGEAGATYPLSSSSDVEITNATSFSVVLSGADLYNVESLLNKDGATSNDSTTFNAAFADDFIAVTTDGDTSSASNGITVSNYAVPTVTSATYDATTGILVVTGTNFVNKSGGTNDVDVSKLAITGEGGSQYQLTSATDVEITSATTYSVTLSTIDKLNINGLLNKDGTTSATAGTTFSLASIEDWMAGTPTGNNVADAAATVTVSNYTSPAVTSATYDYTTNVLTVTGTNFVAQTGGVNDVDVSLLTLTGEGGTTYTLTSATDVEIASATSFSVTLSGADIVNVETLLNKDGTNSASSNQLYNIAFADNWMPQSPVGDDISDATNGVTVSSFTNPTIASTTYDFSTGVLVITGSNFVAESGASNDIDVSLLTFTGEGGTTYTLIDTSNVDVTSTSSATITLSATDKISVNGLLNKDGTTSATAGTTFNVAAADNWMAGSPAGNSIADNTASVTVSNYATPTVTSATYDYNANTLVVTGTNFVAKSGGTNDIDISTLTLTGEGGATYTITSATDVELTSATSFTITLSGSDLTNVESLLNKDGTASISTTTYNVAAADNWLAQAPSGTDIADATSNAITVSNYAVPTVTSSTYDISNGQLVLTGTNFVNLSGGSNDIVANLLTITGEGGTYALTDSSNVDITSATEATLTLSSTDKLNVHGLLNKNGTTSSGATTYNLALADNWMGGSPTSTDIADATGNAINVSNVAVPAITSITYDSDTGTVVVTGTNFFKKVGASNDVDVSMFTFTGGTGDATYTITTATDVELTSATSFSFTLSGADKTNVDTLLDQIGTSSSGGSTYNIAAADDWLAGADSATDISDATSGGTVSINPKITSATYNATTGVVVVTGTNIQANGGGSDIDASTLTFTGEGASTYTLSDSVDVNRDSVSQFTITLGTADKAAINKIANKNGLSSTGATTYNIAAADDWNTNVTAGDTSDTTSNAITVSNVAVPTITSATYDANTGAVVVTGTGFTNYTGTTNDIDSSMFTFTAEGETYTLTDTADVEISSGTAFTLTLSAADKAELNQIINKNGTSSTNTTSYNLAAAEDWAKGADTSVNVVDTTATITASNVAVPTITSATYNASTGVVVVTGTGLLKSDGATNDIDSSTFIFTGQAGATYTLTDTTDVEISSGTSFTLTLSSTDKTSVGNLLNKNGTDSVDSTTYNLNASEDWATGANGAVNVIDATGNAITVSNAPNLAPTIASLNGDTPAFTEDAASVLVDVGTNLTITDNELDALNSANGDYDGSSFVIFRNGGANSDDVFEFSDANSLSLVGTNIQKSAATIATFIQTSTVGELNVTMTNVNGQTPTTTDVQNLLRQIKYKNTNSVPPANVQLDYTFYDGNSDDSQGPGGEQTVTGSATVAITAVNDIPTHTQTLSNFSKGQDFSDFNITINGITDLDLEDLNISVESNNTALVSVTQNWDNNLTYNDYNGTDLILTIKSESTTAKGVAELNVTVNDGDTIISKEFNVSVSDITPDAFSFTALTSQTQSTLLESETVVITGIDDGITLSITNGEYKIGDGDWNTTTTTIDNDENVTLRQTSSESYATTTTTSLTIGDTTASFAVTTKSAPVSSGGGSTPTPEPEPEEPTVEEPVAVEPDEPVAEPTPEPEPEPTPEPTPEKIIDNDGNFDEDLTDSDIDVIIVDGDSGEEITQSINTTTTNKTLDSVSETETGFEVVLNNDNGEPAKTQTILIQNNGATKTATTTGVEISSTSETDENTISNKVELNNNGTSVATFVSTDKQDDTTKSAAITSFKTDVATDVHEDGSVDITSTDEETDIQVKASIDAQGATTHSRTFKDENGEDVTTTASSQMDQSVVSLLEDGTVQTKASKDNGDGSKFMVAVNANTDGHSTHLVKVTDANGEELVTKATSNRAGAVTTVSEDGDVETSSTVNGNVVSASASSDGRAEHSVSVGGGVKSRATSDIKGASTIIKEAGNVETTATPRLFTMSGKTIEAVINTLPNGESYTSFVLTDIATGVVTTLETTNDSTSFEAGNTANVSEEEDELKFNVNSKVTRKLVF